MTRRNLLSTAAGTAALSSGLLAGGPGNAILELRTFRLRNGPQVSRTQEFLSKHFLPAAQRAGIGPLGFFGALVAPESPSVLCLLSYPSLAAMGTALEKLAADKAYAAAADAYDSEPGYVRMESSLFRAFDGAPQVEAPPAGEGHASRIFELRTYESNTAKTLRRKIKMFEDGEIAIFRRAGLLPVFFGEALVGRNLPNLTYMVAFDGMEAREKAWAAFGRDPEWQKLRAQPGLSDAEIVSNISNSILRPLVFSPIR